MVSRLPVIDKDGEVSDLSEVDPSLFKPVSALPASLQAKLLGRPRSVVKKEQISIRLSSEVLDQFKATGNGWQPRIDAALKDWLSSHPAR